MAQLLVRPHRPHLARNAMQCICTSTVHPRCPRCPRCPSDTSRGTKLRLLGGEAPCSSLRYHKPRWICSILQSFVQPPSTLVVFILLHFDTAVSIPFPQGIQRPQFPKSQSTFVLLSKRASSVPCLDMACLDHAVDVFLSDDVEEGMISWRVTLQRVEL